MASNTPRIQSTSPLGDDGVVRCHHGEQAVRFTSRTVQNPNRVFYKCSRIRDSNPECCPFFYWDDQIPRGTATSPVTRSDSISTAMGTSQSSSTLSFTSQAGSSGGPGPCTPLTPQTYGLPSVPHPVTPVKRKSDDVEAGTGFTPASRLPDTASKKARLAAIEAGLKDRQEEQPQQSQQPQQQPQQEEETQSEASQHPPKARFSFLGLPPTQESMTSVSQPSTPKRASSASNVNQLPALLTPPQTSHWCRLGRTFNVNSQRPEPTTPTRHKGKERAHPQYDRFLQEENENPFMEGPSSEGITDKDALPVFSSTQESSLEPLTTAEQINASVTGMDECIQLLSKHLGKFVEMDSVKYIERLERQKKALELGDSAKKRYIARLLAEKEALEQKLRKAEEQSLLKDETIASLKDKIIELLSQR